MVKKKLSEWLWDAWCVCSIIGIWPRFVEPLLLGVKHIQLSLIDLPKELSGLKIVQFSDLHWSSTFSPFLKNKLIHKINALQADIIVFTGDFLCCSKLENREGLQELLKAMRANLGCFAVLGNHDYSRFVTVNEVGDYSLEKPSASSNIVKGWKRLFRSVRLTKRISPEVFKIGHHEDLISLLIETPFDLLDNQTKKISYRGQTINLCGVGEYTLGQFLPDTAFTNYDCRYPGIILSHNPDTIESLKKYPGDLILSGHTHGGQVYLPGLWKRFTLMEHFEYRHGLKKLKNKYAYINRGIASVMKFRWFAPPELTVLTLL